MAVHPQQIRTGYGRTTGYDSQSGFVSLTQREDSSCTNSSHMNHQRPVALGSVDPTVLSESNQSGLQYQCSIASNGGASNRPRKEVDEPIQNSEKLDELRQILAETELDSHLVIVARPKKRGVETERGSKYRGVSKNGKKWQVSDVNDFLVFQIRLNAGLLVCFLNQTTFVLSVEEHLIE